MVDIQCFQNMAIKNMMKLFADQNDVTVDINKIAETLDISVLPHDLSKYQVGVDKVMCAFVTNEQGNACIFYDLKLRENSEYAERVFIMMAFARCIATGENNFIITENEKLSYRENTLVKELLMPQAEVRTIVKRLLIPTTYNIGEIFKVPQDFVRIRLKELKIATMVAGYNY